MTRTLIHEATRPPSRRWRPQLCLAGNLTDQPRRATHRLDLVTLQARKEICNTRYSDYRDGWLYVIRDKVSGESEMGFIRIAVTPQLDEIRRRSLTDGVLSTYLVHRPPKRQRREWTETKPHWTYVNPSYLSKAFGKAREACGRYASLAPAKRPTFGYSGYNSSSTQIIPSSLTI